MKKVGIVTITELDNFGNRLQNYALQTIVQQKGFCVETIPNLITYGYRKRVGYKMRQLAKGIKHHNVSVLATLLRQYRFEKYDRRFFVFSQWKATINTIPKELSNQYDYFIAGSDQIWNPTFVFNFDFNFLTFTTFEKRIAYSASFGVEEIPEKQKKQFREFIQGIKHLSVREMAGQKIISSLTGQNSQVLLDPTMLLTKDEWIKHEKKPYWIKGNYCLIYCLGGGDTRKKAYQFFSNRTLLDKYKIVDISCEDKLLSYSIRPDEFIWLVHHANVIITDSYHCMVFSLLFGKLFVPILRGSGVLSMNSRIETLFSLFQVKCNKDYAQYDYCTYQAILDDERKKANDFLDRALSE